MKKIILRAFLITSLFLTFGCGFKVLDKSEVNNFFIKEIKSTGDKSINFNLKNKLINNSKKDSQNVLLIDLTTKKRKEIKEKNIKNQITKYLTTISTNVKFYIMEKNTTITFDISVTGDYLVGSNNVTTINNEKVLIGNLVDDLSEKILSKISLRMNDI